MSARGQGLPPRRHAVIGMCNHEYQMKKKNWFIVTISYAALGSDQRVRFHVNRPARATNLRHSQKRRITSARPPPIDSRPYSLDGGEDHELRNDRMR